MIYQLENYNSPLQQISANKEAVLFKDIDYLSAL